MPVSRWARRAKLTAAAALVFIGSLMLLDSVFKAALWTVVLFGFIWLAFRIPPQDRQTRP